jgi:hypothetical protein
MKTPYHADKFFNGSTLTEITYADYHPGDQVELAPYTDTRKSGKVLKVNKVDRLVGLETDGPDLHWVSMAEVRPWHYQRHLLLKQYNIGLQAAREIEKFGDEVHWSMTAERFEYKERGLLEMRQRAIFGQFSVGPCNAGVYLGDDGCLEIGSVTFPAEVTRVLGRAIYWLLQNYNSSVDIGEYRLEATRYGIRDVKSGQAVSWTDAERIHKALEHSNINNLNAKNTGDGGIIP